MTVDLKTFPPLWQVVFTAAVAAELWLTGPAWLTVLFRVLTAWWLFTFAYAAVRSRLTSKEN